MAKASQVLIGGGDADEKDAAAQAVARQARKQMEEEVAKHYSSNTAGIPKPADMPDEMLKRYYENVKGRD